MALPHVDPIALPDTITVARWLDPLVEEVGHPMASEYVETFWLPTLGPTTLLLARRLAFIAASGPAQVPLVPLAEALGLRPTIVPNSPFGGAVTRLRVFGVADYDVEHDTLRVRTHLAPLNRSQVKRLPKHLAAVLEAVPA